MIASIRGRPVNLGPDWIIVDVNGIGYKIFVPTTVAGALTGKNDELTVHTYLHVREDAIQLYGFLQEADLEIFELLIQISGIGPKVALAVLSSMPASLFIQAVLNEQVTSLTQIPGVGKKTAQRVIIELKDKFAKMSAGAGMPAAVISSGLRGVADDALQALIVLGYNPVEARKALGRIPAAELESLRPEEIVKLALKEINRA